MFKTIGILILAAGLALSSLRELRLAPTHSESTTEEGLYLPKIEAIKVLSFGYQNILAHLLWFQTINYFGKHYRSDSSYPWLSHMCSLVIELNPGLDYVYKFCGTMLSWEAGEVDNAVEILEKGKRNLPQSWEMPYFKGFTLYYFKKDAAAASKEFLEASNKNNAPLFLKTLAAKALSRDDPDEAIVFLRTAIRNAVDEGAREALRKKLAEVISNRDIPKIKLAAQNFKAQYGRDARNVTELIQAGELSATLDNPGPGRYVLGDNEVHFEYGSK